MQHVVTGHSVVFTTESNRGSSLATSRMKKDRPFHVSSSVSTHARQLRPESSQKKINALIPCQECDNPISKMQKGKETKPNKNAGFMLFRKPKHNGRSVDLSEQLGLQDELALLVLFRVFIGLVILPTNSLLAMSAADVAHDMTAGSHVPLGSFALGDIYDAVEEVGFAMLAAKVLREVCQGCWR